MRQIPADIKIETVDQLTELFKYLQHGYKFFLWWSNMHFCFILIFVV